MEAQETPILNLFETERRLVIPTFQRRYCWNQEDNLEPLWEDISQKFSDSIEGKESPPHFLGPIVLAPQRTPTLSIGVVDVIDGQQRLTTFQILFAAFRDLASVHYPALAQDLNRHCQNSSNVMDDPEVERFRVWPTLLDQPAFKAVLQAGSREAVENLHPKAAKKKISTGLSLMEMTYFFFYDHMETFFTGPSNARLESATVVNRMKKAFLALKSTLKVLVIDLGEKDDPQVIFENLNYGGTPLLPMDLLRNYIFLRADKAKEDAQALHATYWLGFDEEWWQKKVKQGRINRPRGDHFLQHYLTSQIGDEVGAGHTFSAYKTWIQVDKPFKTVEAEIRSLADQRQAFRQISAPDRDHELYHLSKAIEAVDTATVFPVLLKLARLGVTPGQWTATATAIESYLVRRAICQLTTKNYNQVFLAVTKAVTSSEGAVDQIQEQLQSFAGDSNEWPSDAAFKTAWTAKPAYANGMQKKLVHVLLRLSDTYLTAKTEKPLFEFTPTIEHLMPQGWVEHWPLEDGSRGLELLEATAAKDTGPAAASLLRHQKVQVMGNLTLLTQPLNSSVSNGAWTQKRQEIQGHSILPLNRFLATAEEWDEEAIDRRGEDLFKRALVLWPRP